MLAALDAILGKGGFARHWLKVTAAIDNDRDPKPKYVVINGKVVEIKPR